MNPNPIISRLSHQIALVILALVISLTCATASAASIQATPADPDFAAIDKFIETEMQAQRIPGLALGIVHGDQIVHLKGFGIADPSGRAVTPQTPFFIGSTTKSFTALAVMQLVEAGKIELDAPVQRYIPWFRVADLDASSRITVRHLLNQTSGFSRAEGLRQNVNFDTSAAALENRVRLLRDVRLSQPVGATYQYSNCNYATLGLIVQTVSGQSFEAYVQQYIFAPLEMRHSFTSKDAAQRQGLAMGYRSVFGMPLPYDEPFPRGSIPQGFVISSAEDMAHYLIAQVNMGRYGSASVLSPAGIAELHRPAALEGDGETSYGMGWDVGPINGVPAVYHDGDTFSFRSRMVLTPESRWGVVVLSNISNILTERRFQGIANDVASLLVGRQVITVATNDPLIIYSIVVGIVVVQALGMTRTVALLRRWRAQPERRPRSRLSLVWHGAGPLLVNASWALLVLVWLPRAFMPLTVLLLGVPDIGMLLVLSAAVAFGWGILRTALMFLALRKPLRPHPVGAPVKA